MDRVVDSRSAEWHRRAGRAASRRSTATTTTPRARRTSAREVWLSRKGAIDAHDGCARADPGLDGRPCPTSCAGKGHPGSLCSSPHGAGRNYSRSAARKRFTRADLDERMAGIAWGHSDAFLDEHPEAYKPIDVVMRDAARPGRGRPRRCARSSTSRATNRVVRCRACDAIARSTACRMLSVTRPARRRLRPARRRRRAPG